jgi:hypothetical protein
MGLAGILAWVFESKGVKHKVFQNKGLMSSNNAENGFGADSGGVFVNGRFSELPQPDLIVGRGRG